MKKQGGTPLPLRVKLTRRKTWVWGLPQQAFFRCAYTTELLAFNEHGKNTCFPADYRFLLFCGYRALE